MNLVNLHDIFGISDDKVYEIATYAIRTRQHKTETTNVIQLLEWVNTYQEKERDFAMWCAGAVYGLSEIRFGDV